MSDNPVSPFRQRIIEDMTIRSFGDAIQRDYRRGIKNLSIFIERSPDTAALGEIRQFQFTIREQAANSS